MAYPPTILRNPFYLASLCVIPIAVQAEGGRPDNPIHPVEAGAAVHGEFAPPHRHQDVVEGLDVTQAHLMLDLLESISEGRKDRECLDALMSSEGTELIVGQMNLARRVSMVQYRTLLTGLMEGRKPDIEPVDSTARSRNGVDGLLENAWPLLNWGLGHTGVLRRRVDHLQDLDFFESAHAVASRFLPDSIEAPPRVFAVLGGRAGAAKIAPDRLYLDVLVYSYRDKDSVGFPSDAELIRTIGHEMHHMGYRSFLDRKIESLGLGQSERLLFEFVSGLLSEGAATYLISHDRSLAALRERRSTRDYLTHHRDLITTSESVLKAILDGEIRTAEEYEEATADLLGMWFHSAGSLMLGVIDEAGGLNQVMKVVAEPGKLLVEYNRAVRLLGREAELRIFDDHLAGALVGLLG